MIASLTLGAAGVVGAQSPQTAGNAGSPASPTPDPNPSAGAPNASPAPMPAPTSTLFGTPAAPSIAPIVSPPDQPVPAPVPAPPPEPSPRPIPLPAPRPTVLPNPIDAPGAATTQSAPPPSTSSRVPRKIADDASLRAVRRAVKGAGTLKAARKNGRLVLTGTAHTQAEKDALGAKASAAAGGQPVVNEVVVQ